MGQIADTILKGEACEWCGVHLEKNEPIYKRNEHKKYNMPENGTGFGVPVICEDCYKDEIL